MELALLVYALGLITSIHGLLVILVALVFPISILAFGIMMNFDHWETLKQSYRENKTGKDAAKLILARNLKITKRLCIGMVVAILLLVAIPSEKTAYMMVGAYAVQKVAQDPRTEQTTSKVISLINKKLDEYIK